MIQGIVSKDFVAFDVELIRSSIRVHDSKGNGFTVTLLPGGRFEVNGTSGIDLSLDSGNQFTFTLR